jgi:hypothetical protein
MVGGPYEDNIVKDYMIAEHMVDKWTPPQGPHMVGVPYDRQMDPSAGGTYGRSTKSNIRNQYDYIRTE